MKALNGSGSSRRVGNHPELNDWAQALDEVIRQTDEPAILIAHSLACLLVAHWAAHSQLARRVAELSWLLFLIQTGLGFPLAEAGTFADPPSVPLPFPALILASTNDPYASFEHAERRAFDWKAGIIDVGALGHVNSASGLGRG